MSKLCGALYIAAISPQDSEARQPPPQARLAPVEAQADVSRLTGSSGRAGHERNDSWAPCAVAHICISHEIHRQIYVDVQMYIYIHT